MNAHYVPKKNKHYARYLFNEIKQKKDESVINYTARVQEKARYCDFGGQEDEQILEHLIQTIENKDLVLKSITLQQLLKEASQYESTNMELAEMKTSQVSQIAWVERHDRGRAIHTPED